MDKEINSEISYKLPENYLPRLQQKLLKQHFIPERDYWNIENFEEFTEQRVKLIIEFMKEHYNEIIKDKTSNTY